MRKEIVKKLNKRVKEIAMIYSKEDRDKNTNNEIFTVYKIIPLSEFSAAVIYEKQPTGKRVMASFEWINMGEGHWRYYFPTDSHLLGLSYLPKIKQSVEMFNYDKN
jgi:hypothetical protein